MFTLKKNWDNGYGCGCCGQQWETKRTYETLEAALEAFPIWVSESEDDQLRGFTLRDGRKKIGWAQLGFTPWSWSGHHPVLGDFTAVSIQGDTDDFGLWSCADNPEWDKLLQVHNRETLEKALKGAQEDLEYEQRRVGQLGGRITELRERLTTG
jgi:hypothetical protein